MEENINSLYLLLISYKQSLKLPNVFHVFQVFLKIDKFGNGLEIDQARLGNCKQLGNVFTEEKFRYMCILSGCDYLSSIHGIGLAKACKLLKLANNPDIIKVNLVSLCILAAYICIYEINTELKI